MLKRLIMTNILALILIVVFAATSLAATEEANQAANHLYELKLLNGVSIDSGGSPNFALDRTLTRQEGIALIVRLLGKETEALNGNWQSPFTDVDSWAKPYVNYAYTHHITRGISDNAFGGGIDNLSPAHYITFILRALGYSSNSDFKWDSPWKLSDSLGISISRFSKQISFTRGDAVVVSDLALDVKIKDTTHTLYDTLPITGGKHAPVVALTFDDGPSKSITPLLLAALAERGVKATFFMLGEWAFAYPDIVLSAYEAGNQICNHTYDHLDLTSLSSKELTNQINNTSSIIEDITGEAPLYIRPPYGYIDKATEDQIGVPLMLWTVDPRDWESKNADEIYDYVMANIYDGAVILMHDQYPSTYEAAIRIIDTLIDQNWCFLTLEEYYRHYRITLSPGHTYRGTREATVY